MAQLGARPPVEVFRSHTIRHTHAHTRTRQDSSEHVVSPSQRHNTQMQQTNIHALNRIRNRDPSNRASARPPGSLLPTYAPVTLFVPQTAKHEQHALSFESSQNAAGTHKRETSHQTSLASHLRFRHDSLVPAPQTQWSYRTKRSNEL